MGKKKNRLPTVDRGFVTKSTPKANTSTVETEENKKSNKNNNNVKGKEPIEAPSNTNNFKYKTSLKIKESLAYKERDNIKDDPLGLNKLLKDQEEKFETKLPLALKLENRANQRINKIEEHKKLFNKEKELKGLPVLSFDSDVPLCEDLIKWAKEKSFLKRDDIEFEEEEDLTILEDTQIIKSTKPFEMNSFNDSTNKEEQLKCQLIEAELFALKYGFEKEEIREAIKKIGKYCNEVCLLDYLVLNKKDLNQLPTCFKDGFLISDEKLKGKDIKDEQPIIIKEFKEVNKNQRIHISSNNNNGKDQNKQNNKVEQMESKFDEKLIKEIEDLYYFSSDNEEEDYSLSDDINEIIARGSIDLKIYEDLLNQAKAANHKIYIYVINRKKSNLEKRIIRMKLSIFYKEKEIQRLINNFKSENFTRIHEIKDLISVDFDEEIQKAQKTLKEEEMKNSRGKESEEEEENFELDDLFENDGPNLEQDSISNPILPTLNIDLSIPKSWTGKTPYQILQGLCRPHRAEVRYQTSITPLVSTLNVSYKQGNSTLKRQFASNQPPLLGDEATLASPRPWIKVHDRRIAEHLVATIALFELGWLANFSVLPPCFRQLVEGWAIARQQIKKLGQYTEIIERLEFVESVINDNSNSLDMTMDNNEEIKDSKTVEALNESPPKPVSHNNISSKKLSELNSNYLPINLYWQKAKAGLETQFEQRKKTTIYNTLLQQRKELPIHSFRQQLIEALYPERNSSNNKTSESPSSIYKIHSNVILVVGETGCGKTTQVPQFLVEDAIEQGFGKHCNILCTQPRRISATSIAERVSLELGDGPDQLGNPGSLVGYRIRLSSKAHSSNLLTFCTLGVLLRQLESDPKLLGVTHLVIDEVQERSLDTDFLLAVLRRLLRSGTHLKIVLMSATIDKDKLKNYFDGCQVLTVPGRTFPVKVYHLEDTLKLIGYRGEFNEGLPSDDSELVKENENIALDQEDPTLSLASDKLLDGITIENPLNPYEMIIHLLQHILTREPTNTPYPKGAILIFLPGIPEIRRLHEALLSYKLFQDPMKVQILEAHSLVPNEQQKKIFQLAQTWRKVVLATNIAETGITIPDVTIVIDTGLMKQIRFDKKWLVRRLEETWVSKANALQRQGRAGRVQSGLCFRLYTQTNFNKLISYQLPEMRRLPLEELCLKVKVLNEDIIPFLNECLDPPSLDLIKSSIQLLKQVGALTLKESLTSLGIQLSKLPMDIHLGKMLIYGLLFQCLDPILTITAILSYKSFLLPNHFELRKNNVNNNIFKVGCDFIYEYNEYCQWRKILKEKGKSAMFQLAKKKGWNLLVLNELEMMKQQYFNLLKDFKLLEGIKLNNSNNKNNNSTYKDILKLPNELTKNENNFGLIKLILMIGLYPKILINDINSLINNNNNNLVLKLFKPKLPNLTLTTSFLSQLFHTKLPPFDFPIVKISSPSQFQEFNHFNQTKKFIENSFIIYHHLIQTKNNYLTTNAISFISPLTILLFGKQLIYIPELKLVVVDSVFRFKAFGRMIFALIQLRLELKKLIDIKLNDKNNDELNIKWEEVINWVTKLTKLESW